jgi:DNA-binding IscR family transcriptional regulator
MDWVKMPTTWISENKLKLFKWSSAGEGSQNTAALMAYIALCHRLEADASVLAQIPENEWGFVRVTYDDLTEATSISRTKLSQGLTVLENYGLIGRSTGSQSTYNIHGCDGLQPWGKLPYKSLYMGNRIFPFKDFLLRKGAELHALKLYLLLIARRDRKSNLAIVNYDTIERYSGIPRQHIRTAVSILAVAGLLHVEKVRSWEREGMANAYRIAHIDSYNHRGTQSDDEISTMPNIAQDWTSLLD